LRRWQSQALAHYLESPRKDFLVTATPGAGKTAFALTLAADLLGRRVIDRVIVVAPTDHLRSQWAYAGARYGIALDPSMSNAVGPVAADMQGYVTTYAQVAAKPTLHAARATVRRSLVVLDEIHHAGDGLSWGEAVESAFDDVSRRVCLTGTPFRTRAGERIPFVNYEPNGDDLVSAADFGYGYTEALRDGVVRPVVFAAYTGTTRWRNSAGEVVAASLTDAGTKSGEQAAWRTALDPRGDWVAHVIAAMDERLTHLRETGMPDAGALVLASDRDDARAYAEVVRRVTGVRPYLILSDDPKASRKISEFAADDSRMAVCVRMVSEGVDIPRIACLAWLTSYRTPLFFAQAVGRVLRARGPHESATVFLPAVRPLLTLAAELENDRNHVLMPPPAGDGLDLVDDLIERPERAPNSLGAEFEALEAEAQFAHLLHAGRAVTGSGQPGNESHSQTDQDYLGLPGLLSAEQTAVLLAQRDSALRRKVSASRAAMSPPMAHAVDAGSASADVSKDTRGVTIDGATSDDELQAAVAWRAAADLRREVNRLVSVVAARTGTPHGALHARLRSEVPGPASASAPIAILQARREHLMRQL
jgi:superfamily II DNA or RNA helicase